MLALAIQDSSPSDWEAFVEGNVAVFTDWLSGRSDNLVLFIPTESLNDNLQNSLNKNIQQVTESADIPECSEEQVDEIIREGGFDTDQQLCLPTLVKTGEQSLSEFLGVQDSDILNNLVQNNYLNLQRDRYAFDSIDVPGQVVDFINGPLNSIRNFLLSVRQSTPVAFLVGLVVLVFYFLLAWLAKKDMLRVLAKFCRSIGLSLIVLSSIAILFLGGTYFLNVTLFTVISPVFSLGEISSLILWTVLNVAFNMVAPTIWAGLGLIVAWLILSLIASGRKKSFNQKNHQILSHEPDYQKAQTFDSQFRQAVSSGASAYDQSTLEHEQISPKQQSASSEYQQATSLPAQYQAHAQKSGFTFTDEYFQTDLDSRPAKKTPQRSTYSYQIQTQYYNQPELSQSNQQSPNTPPDAQIEPKTQAMPEELSTRKIQL